MQLTHAVLIAIKARVNHGLNKDGIHSLGWTAANTAAVSFPTDLAETHCLKFVLF